MAVGRPRFTFSCHSLKPRISFPPQALTAPVKVLAKVWAWRRLMAFVRMLPNHRRRRAVSRTTLVVAGLSAWLVLGLLSQVGFQLIG